MYCESGGNPGSRALIARLEYCFRSTPADATAPSRCPGYQFLHDARTTLRSLAAAQKPEAARLTGRTASSVLPYIGMPMRNFNYQATYSRFDAILECGDRARARFEERTGDLFAGLTRRDRRPCRYSVYLPDLLSGDRLRRRRGCGRGRRRGGSGQAQRSGGSGRHRGPGPAAVAMVASSRIEGLVVGGRRLLRADAARQLGEAIRDVTAAEVLAKDRCHGLGR